MKALLALVTCHDANYDMRGMVSYPKHPKAERRPAIKATWLNDVDIDYKWFFGRHPLGEEPATDEVFLDCPDDYYSLPHKTRAIARWARCHGYDRVFKVDDDTYINWERFKHTSGFQYEEYSGGCWAGSVRAFGGAYVMAGQLLQAVTETPIPIGVWGEDQWVATLAIRHGVPFHNDPAYHHGAIDPRTNVQTVFDAVLYEDRGYAVLNPLTSEQMVRYHEVLKRG